MDADVGQECFMMVDGTNFKIQEPIPFDPKWCSHKFKGPGVRYEIGICIKTSYIVCINGPYPAGEYSDRKIASLFLDHAIETWERYIADGGYADILAARVTPTGLHNYSDTILAQARAQHETINRLFKRFNCLNECYRHTQKEHYMWFAPSALIAQLDIENGGGTFQIEYNKDEFD